jgi:uncharacterized protein with ParB-like and HNH nuclease domain
MKSENIPVQQVFQDRRQYLVPFYQRAYVWNKEEQGEPTSRSNSPTFYGSSLNLPKLSTTRDTSLPDLTAL